VLVLATLLDFPSAMQSDRCLVMLLAMAMVTPFEQELDLKLVHALESRLIRLLGTKTETQRVCKWDIPMGVTLVSRLVLM